MHVCSDRADAQLTTHVVLCREKGSFVVEGLSAHCFHPRPEIVEEKTAGEED
jgi:hypothetical protein